MSSLRSTLAFTRSNRVATGLLALAVLAVGVVIYVSPSADPHLAGPVRADSARSLPGAPTATKSPAAKPRPTPSPVATPTASHTPVPAGTQTVYRSGRDRISVRTATSTRVVHAPTQTRSVTSTSTVVVTAPGGKKVTVHVPAKTALIEPAQKYYGLAEDGLPGSSKQFDALDTSVGKAPNLVEWFEYWDDSFSAQKVVQAWSRNALPVITWQSVPHDYADTANSISAYSLKRIAAGGFDKYLRNFASSITQTGLPLAIRLDQEMNGNWYPWSAGYRGRGISNTPADFVAAWRHVWQVFQDAGANRYVIWAWTPSRTDTLIPDAKTGYSAGDTGMAEDYPGDDVVDWTGLSAYQFRPTQPATYNFIFGGTLDGNSADVGLRDVADKPIFIAEMGSAQVVGNDIDNTTAKVAFTTESLARFAKDPDIVGFVLFNNDVDGVHEVKLVDGTHVKVRTNWKLDSSPAALTAFRNGVSTPVYGSGLMPQPAGVTVGIDKP
jgi:hypothetical protein